MPTLKLSIAPETYTALFAAARAHLRPPDYHAEALLRQALGLAFPIPTDMAAPECGSHEGQTHA